MRPENHGSLTRLLASGPAPAQWLTASLLVAGIVTGFFVGGPATGQGLQVSALGIRHHSGQTFLTWGEVGTAPEEATATVKMLVEMKKKLTRDAQTVYRVYRSEGPIGNVGNLKPIAEVYPLSGWNTDLYGAAPPPTIKAPRYVVEDGGDPVPVGTALYVHNPRKAGQAYYAVTVVIDGRENRALSLANRSQVPTAESVGPGLPVLQGVERPPLFAYVERPMLYRYVRWEAPPHSNIESRAFDYLVAVPENAPKRAPIGIHLHAWGGSMYRDFGWWYNAANGAVLISSNSPIPFDWWTGYHDRLGSELKTRAQWRAGMVRPYTQKRLLSFVDWAAGRFELDKTRTFAAGNSMGGSGAIMLAIRYPQQIAWVVSWVGIHRPAMSPTFHGSYEHSYGPPEFGVTFQDGTPVWDYYDDVWFLRRHPETGIGLLTFSNGKNDNGIGWQQAVDFYQALQDTRQPHVFVWGQSGHGERAQMPGGGQREMPMDLRTDQSLPAFTRCQLDDNPGNGIATDGDTKGQVNLYLLWDTNDIVDTSTEWEITVRLAKTAPTGDTRVDVTPRRWQQFRMTPGERVFWTNRHRGSVVQKGEAVADTSGLVLLPQMIVTKQSNRIRIWKE